MATKVFVSFDYDNDEDLKILFCGQAKHSDTPFEIKDMSVKQALVGDWKEKVRLKIRAVDQVVVICGRYTDRAEGVNAEVEIAQEEGKDYFFLNGRSGETGKLPIAAWREDKLYKWTWLIVGQLLRGLR